MSLLADNDASSLRREIWRELHDAIDDRAHPWRTPVIATVSEDGLPEARTIVLRGVDGNLEELQFYTDARSPKARQLRAKESATLVFWNPAKSCQLRVRCTSRVVAGGSEVESLWRRISGTPAASDYCGTAAPGTPLTAAGSDPGVKHYLAIVKLAVIAMDWLELGENGRRRALISANATEWLLP